MEPVWSEQADDALMSLLFTDDLMQELAANMPPPLASFTQPGGQGVAWGQQQQQQQPHGPPQFQSLFNELQSEADPMAMQAAAPTPPPPLGEFALASHEGGAHQPASRTITTQLHRVSHNNSSDTIASSSASAGRSLGSGDPTSADSSSSRGPPSRSNSGNNSGTHKPSPHSLRGAPQAMQPPLLLAGSSGSGSLPSSGSGQGANGSSGTSGGMPPLIANNNNAVALQQLVAYSTQALSTLETTTTRAGWQELLQKLQEGNVPILPPQSNGAKRGRKPTTIINGVPIAKPVKDKKRENGILIKQLEAQLAEKLTLVKGLEGENTDLKRKERLLQLSVDTSEHNLNRIVDPALDKNLKPLLQSFRSAYNKSAAERVLAKLANVNSPKEMTLDLFVTCWQALVMEMCDALMAEATAATPEALEEADKHLDLLHEKVIDFVMAMCATDCSIIQTAQSRNMHTGEEANQSYEFWEGVVDKLALTKDQLLDMIAAFDMFARLMERNLGERRQLKEELDCCIAKEAEMLEQRGNATCSVDVANASEKLAANMARTDVLHTLLSFITLRLMNRKQTAQMSMHSAPFFPSLIRMQVAIRKCAERLGIVAPLVITQHPNTRPGMMDGVVQQAFGAPTAAGPSGLPGVSAPLPQQPVV